MADTVAVMNHGAIEQMGAPQELYELPRTAFVANFLGQSNLFTGAVTASTGQSIVVDVAGVKIEVPKERAQRHTGEVTVGVRPEKLILHTSAPKAAPGINALGPGRVTDVSFSGVSTQYQIAIPGVGLITLFAQNMVFGPVANVGAEAWVTWTVDHGFGLIDEPGHAPKFAADTDTATIAVQTRRELLAEIEGA
jgi:spermidine/putrescine transport system ATP-binding protein